MLISRKKKKKPQINKLTLHFRELKKDKLSLKLAEGKESTKAGAKIYEIETRKIIGRSTKPGPDFWER